MEKLARQIYRDHRRVLDFVVEHGHGTSTDFAIACKAVFGEEFGEDLVYPDVVDIGKQSYVFHYSDGEEFSFLPKSWFDAFGGEDHYRHGCEDWYAGLPLLTWIELTSDADGTSGQICLYGEVGPLADHSFRTDLINTIQGCSEKGKQLRIKFQRGATDEGKKFSLFFKNNFFPVDDVQDRDKIAVVIKKALKSFRTEFKAIAAILPPFIRHGKKLQ